MEEVRKDGGGEVKREKVKKEKGRKRKKWEDRVRRKV